MAKITFKPSGMTVTDVFADGAFVGSIRKDRRNWRFHAKGDLTGTELSASATLSRKAVTEILTARAALVSHPTLENRSQ